MVSGKNTAELWDNLWKDIPIERDRYNFIKEEKGIRWQRIERKVLENFGSFKDLEVIEIGAGVGINAALMAKCGAKITVLDYSVGALKRARTFFKRNGLTAKYINQDALKLRKSLFSKYDISMSFGLAEHFKDEKRRNIIKSHFDLLKPSGVTFISVPNKYNIPYEAIKYAAQKSGKWGIEEYPFTRKEFKNICKELGVSRFSFFGDSFISLPGFLNPSNIITTKIMKKDRKLNTENIKKQRGTFLDQYFGYALVLCAKKI